MKKFPQVVLLLDDEWIKHKHRLSRTFFQPKKHDNNPLLMSGQKPWDTIPLIFGSVRFDPFLKRYRMWYHSCLPVVPGENVHNRMVLALAESPDGIQWRRKYTDIIPWHTAGKLQQTNILFQSTKTEHFIESGSIIINPDAAGTRRYLMTYCAMDKTRPPSRDGRYYRTAWSQEGIHWHRSGRIPFSSPGCVDRHALIRHPDTGKYLFFFRGEQPFREPISTRDPAERTVCLQTSTDLKQWSDAQVIMAPDSGDSSGMNIYSMMPFFRGNTLLGVHQMHDQHCERETVTLHLSWSHDTVIWQRRKESFIPLGTPGTWDRFNNAIADAPLIIDDTMVFHYSGRCHRHAGYQPRTRPDSGSPFGGIGIATLTLDRFASLSSSFNGGTFTTKPMLWPIGKQLYLNAECRWGSIDITVRYSGMKDETGQMHLENKSGVKLPVEIVMPDDNRPIELTLTLTNASVYALYCE